MMERQSASPLLPHFASLPRRMRDTYAHPVLCPSLVVALIGLAWGLPRIASALVQHHASLPTWGAATLLLVIIQQSARSSTRGLRTLRGGLISQRRLRQIILTMLLTLVVSVSGIVIEFKLSGLGMNPWAQLPVLVYLWLQVRLLALALSDPPPTRERQRQRDPLMARTLLKMQSARVPAPVPVPVRVPAQDPRGQGRRH